MCDMLVTYEGGEIWSISDFRDYGANIPDDIEDSCLCRVDVESLTREHSSEWKKGHRFFATYEEVGPDGKTWYEGFDIFEETGFGTIFIERSDGRKERSIKDILGKGKNNEQ